MNRNIKKLKQLYETAITAKVGDEIICPSCNTKFIKTHYQMKFCKTNGKTRCKDHYWNNIVPTKRNNRTRISPASAEWLRKNYRESNNFNPDDYEHPFSPDALGQW